MKWGTCSVCGEHKMDTFMRDRTPNLDPNIQHFICRLCYAKRRYRAKKDKPGGYQSKPDPKNRNPDGTFKKGITGPVTKKDLAGYSIIGLMNDQLKYMFSNVSWNPWRIALSGMFNLPISDNSLLPGMDSPNAPIGMESEAEIKTGIKTDSDFLNLCTARKSINEVASEAWLVVGRKGGKSQIAALVAIYLGCCRDYPNLGPGEHGVVMLLAQKREQAVIVKDYVSALLHMDRDLERLIEKETQSTIELKNNIQIKIQTANFKSLRGPTVVGAVCDEIAFWQTETGANPDVAILEALRPAMATVSNSLIVAISSPYARKGELWNSYKTFYGKDSDIFVWKAPTWAMNSTIKKKKYDRAYERDSAWASGEYGAEFRTDIEAFITQAAIDNCTVENRLELLPSKDTSYVGFVDPSGGSQDSFTAAVAHQDKEGVVVLDAIREVQPPFSPENATVDLSGFLKSYRLASITGDRYAGEWPREQFRKQGLDYLLSEHTKSDIYKNVLPLVNSGRIELLDMPRLTNQLMGLERKTARGGRDSIDHAPNAHDDVANSACGAMLLTHSAGRKLVSTMEIVEF